MDYNASHALELLRHGSGLLAAQFRESQEEAIRHIVVGKGKLLVVQKTGWGKSFVYFIAAKLLRESGAGPALLISPLLSLMRNQIAAAARMGVQAVTINSDNTAEWRSVATQLQNDVVDVLLIAPERLANDDFREGVLPDIAGRVALLVIDEAHCISDWGHDFRPDYRRIERTVRNLPANIQILATTATANNRVMDDLVEILGPDIAVMRGDLNRPSLFLQTFTMDSQVERLAWLAEQLAAIPGSGIIYTLTGRAAEQVTRWLRSCGLEVKSYTSRSENREQLEQELLDNQVKALVATVALGMGFDKPDLSFVIHYQTPGSVVHYYQQVGRAGRSVDSAYGVLLSGVEDTEITDFFIRHAFPTRTEVEQIRTALAQAPGGLTLSEIASAVNIHHNRIERATELLSLEAPPPIVRQGSRWRLTAARLSSEFWERAERLTALRYAEQQQMQEYVALDSGHMEFLIRALDGVPGNIQQPPLPPLLATVGEGTVQRAVEFLRRTSRPINPRRQWPNRRNIPGAQQAQPGRALCYWGDAGWGDLVRSGKYRDGRFADDLVSASAQLIREWHPRPAPTWVTCIPSRRHPDLAPDFAQRLAKALDLPFQAALVKTQDRQPQKDMANSVQQARNVEGSLGIVRDSVMPGPVLLVDDMVDSRWTFTVAAQLLRAAGCSAVFPYALADAGTG